MAIKYTRLLSDVSSPRINAIFRWARSNLPLPFLKQEIVLVSIVSVSLILLTASTFFIPLTEYELIQETSNKNLNYGVVVDCGSSGTRAHIFKWFKNDTRKSLPRIELLRDRSTGKAITKHITPGLSTLHSDPEKASDYMEPIMKFISDSVPSNRHLDTPIFFMATAGLRLLADSTQKKILTDIIRDLRVKFDFPRIKGQVIPGEYEGIYSWLSLNLDRIYQLDNSTSSKSLGMIEMGGASVQVTFELTPEVENSILKDLENNDAIATFKKEQVVFDLTNGNSVKLFATTFLGLGVNVAREAATDLLIRDHLLNIGELGKPRSDEELKNYELRLSDPCLTSGSSEIVRRPIEVATITSQSIGFNLKHQNRAFNVRLEGSGNFLNCINLLERVIQTVKSTKLNCSPSLKTCPMALLAEKFIPYQHYQFAGLSEMFFTTNEMMNLAGNFNKSRVLHETNKICSANYNSLIEKHAHNGLITHQDRILYECFKASWLLTVLHDSGFKMPSGYAKFETVEQINGREIDWTIGAVVSIALHETNTKRLD